MPVVGHFLEFARNRGPLLAKLYRKHGPCFRIKLGPKTIVILGGPELLQFAAKDAGRVLHAGPAHASFVNQYGGNNMLFGADLEPHFHRRKTLMPQFTPRAVMSSLPVMVNVTREVLPSWFTGAPLDLTQRIKRLVIHQSGMILTSRSADHLYEDLCTTFEGTMALNMLGVPPSWGRWVPVYAKAKRRVMAFCETVIAERQAMPRESRPGDFIDLLIDALEPNGDPIPQGEREALVLLPFLGGLDTVSHSTAFLLYEILANPGLFMRCRAEADTLFPDGKFDPSRLRGLVTLEAAVTETLRRYPIADPNLRVAAESFEFNGCWIEKGTFLCLANSLSHHLEEFYPDPTRFDADRGLGERNQHAQPGAFAAFGSGPHKCIASRLGEAQMLITAATLLHFARLELDPPGYKLQVTSFPILGPKRLHVRCFPRHTAPVAADSAAAPAA